MWSSGYAHTTPHFSNDSRRPPVPGLPALPGGPFFVRRLWPGSRPRTEIAPWSPTSCSRWRSAGRHHPRQASSANGPYGRACPRSVTVLPNAWRPVMHERPNCRCPLCLLEEKLRAELREERADHFLVLGSGPHLAAFRTAADPLLNLQSLAGNSASDPLLSELLEARVTFPGGFADSVLILLFLPMLHATLRRMRQRYPALSREDGAQQTLGTLFASLASPRLAERRSYVAFAICEEGTACHLRVGRAGSQVPARSAAVRRSARNERIRIRRGLLRARRAPASFLRPSSRTRNAHPLRTRSAHHLQARRRSGKRRVLEC
jgi:hypothetical protein